MTICNLRCLLSGFVFFFIDFVLCFVNEPLVRVLSFSPVPLLLLITATITTTMTVILIITIIMIIIITITGNP